MLRLFIELPEKIRKFAADASGVTAIEYVLIAGGIAVAIIVTVNLLGVELAALFASIKNAI